MPLINNPEDLQISSTELRKIKVSITRKIFNISTVDPSGNELQRDIVSPENVVVTRRAGEGAKPIFEREALIRAGNRAEEIEEYRTVVIAKDVNLENKPHKSKRHSISWSPTRAESHSHRWTPSRHFSGRSRNRSRERHDDRRSTESCHLRDEENWLKERRSRRYHSRSRERDSQYSGRSRNRSRERHNDRRSTESCHLRDEENWLKERRSRRYHSRSRERDSQYSNKSYENGSRERRMPAQHIPIPIHICCSNFPPGPVESLVPIHEQVGYGGYSHPMLPFGSRFPPENGAFGPRY